ncbi:MAG TPA: hypothetical protein VFI39_02600 [Gemmatimonadales bacterium]|nr:hypothetical protein [Gemmatimonadales bacterium]
MRFRHPALLALAVASLPTLGAAQARAFGADAAALAPYRDSFTVLVRSTPLGFRTVELDRVRSGWRYADVTQIGAFVLQRTEIDLDAAGAIRQVMQGGQVQGIDIRTSLTYRGGRAVGVTVAPAGGKAVTVTVNAAVPAGTVDDNAIPLYLSTLAWGSDTAWSFPAFVSGENALHTMRVHITDTATVDVPAGRFSTWVAELDGGPTAVRFFVTKSSPHRIVREELVGTPIEFVLVH